MNLRLQPFGGTSAYVPGVNAGEIEFGLANELETHYAVTGQVIYKDKPQADLRVVAILTPLLFQFLRAQGFARSRPSPTSRASACRAISSASACSTCSPKARWPTPI